LRVREGFFRISLDKRFEERGLPNTRGANDGDESRGWFVGDSIDLRDMEPLLLDL
jgi:hypothetical protein